MKRLIFLVIAAALAIYVSADNGTSMKPIMDKADQIVDKLENELDQEIVHMEYDLLSSTKDVKRRLSKGWTYLIVAFGDYRFQDIDLKVYRDDGNQWTLVDKDNDESAISVVSVTPEYDCEYLFEIKAYSFKSGYSIGHYGLIVAHEL